MRQDFFYAARGRKKQNRAMRGFNLAFIRAEARRASGAALTLALPTVRQFQGLMTSILMASNGVTSRVATVAWLFPRAIAAIAPSGNVIV